MKVKECIYGSIRLNYDSVWDFQNRAQKWDDLWSKNVIRLFGVRLSGANGNRATGVFAIEYESELITRNDINQLIKRLKDLDCSDLALAVKDYFKTFQSDEFKFAIMNLSDDLNDLDLTLLTKRKDKRSKRLLELLTEAQSIANKLADMKGKRNEKTIIN